MFKLRKKKKMDENTNPETQESASQTPAQGPENTGLKFPCPRCYGTGLVDQDPANDAPQESEVSNDEPSVEDSEEKKNLAETEEDPSSEEVTEVPVEKVFATCPECNGGGVLANDVCKRCEGTGKI